MDENPYKAPEEPLQPAPKQWSRTKGCLVMLAVTVLLIFALAIAFVACCTIAFVMWENDPRGIRPGP